MAHAQLTAQAHTPRRALRLRQRHRPAQLQRRPRGAIALSRTLSRHAPMSHSVPLTLTVRYCTRTRPVPESVPPARGTSRMGMACGRDPAPSRLMGASRARRLRAFACRYIQWPAREPSHAHSQQNRCHTASRRPMRMRAPRRLWPTHNRARRRPRRRPSPSIRTAGATRAPSTPRNAPDARRPKLEPQHS